MHWIAILLSVLLMSCATQKQSNTVGMVSPSYHALAVYQLSDGTSFSETYPITISSYREYYGVEASADFDIAIDKEGKLLLLDASSAEDGVQDLVSEFAQAASKKRFKAHAGKWGYVFITFRIFADGNTASIINKTQRLEDQGLNEEALSFIAEIHPSDNDAVAVLVLKGEILANLDGREQAVKYYSKGIEQSPNNERIYYARAYRWKALGELDQALRDLHRSLELDASHWQTYDLLSDIYRAKKNYPVAKKYATLGLNYRKDYYFYNQRGWIHQHNDESELALQDFERAVELSPENTSVLSGLARAQYDLARYDEALINVDKALRIDGNNNFDLHIRGLILEELRRYDEARQCYQLIIDELKPDDTTFNNLGWVYMLAGNYQKAVEVFNMQVSMGLGSGHQRSNLSTSYFMLGEYEKSIATLGTAIDSDKGDTSFEYALRARNYIKMGQLDEAYKDLMLVMRYDPHYYDALFNHQHGKRGNHLAIILDELIALASEQKNNQVKDQAIKWKATMDN